MRTCVTSLGLGGLIWSIVGLLLLDLCVAQQTPAPCPTGATPGALEAPQYVPISSQDTNSGFMSGLVQSFLGSVQPNPFPKEFLVKLIEDNNQISNEETIKEILRYEVGFLVCVAIGILYILLMPLVGFCFACCRCCGNCGGRMYQEQTKRIHCRRWGLYWTTMLITLVILAGNVCMFFSNESTRVSVKNSPVELDNTLGNLHTYLTDVPQQIDRVVDESFLTVDEVTSNLNDIGPLLGSKIQNRLGVPLNPALDSVRHMSQVVNSTRGLLAQMNGTLGQLRPDLDELQANLTGVRDRINSTLQKPACVGCASLLLDSLTLDTSITIPGLSELQSAVDQAVKADLNARVREGEEYFNGIPQLVTNKTRDSVQGVQQQLQDIKTKISQVSNEIPLSALTDISNTLKDVQLNLKNYSPQIEKAEQISWIIGTVLCCLILLVVMCNILGLLLGPAGLRPKDDPTERSCTADCGGTFLMMGVGFSFLFSWLFMLVVLILFLVGGNAYTLICEPWKNDALFQIIDTPGLIPGFSLSGALGLKTNLTIGEVYTDCKKDQPLWTTLHLEEIVDLNDLLNVTKYTEEIQQAFENSDITISAITLLSPEVHAQLESFSHKADSVKFSSVIQKINTFSETNLSTTVDKLVEIANSLSDTTIKSELHAEANDLREIQTEIDNTIMPQVLELNSTLESLRVIASQMNGTVGSVLHKVEYAQTFLNSSTTQIVKAESKEFLDCQMGYFVAFVDWANFTITRQVGRCGPVAGAVDSAEMIVCLHIVESLNAFWFSLGWCMVFLIPSIILSVKLAKFYRRMKHTDVYENHMMPMSPFPRANLKPY